MRPKNFDAPVPPEALKSQRVEVVKKLLVEMASVHAGAEDFAKAYAGPMAESMSQGPFEGGVESDAVEQLLRDAKEAHTAYEKSPDVVPHDWADWYAEFVVDNITSS